MCVLLYYHIVVRVVAELYDTLSPLMTEIKEDLATVNNEMREGLTAVKENLTNIQQQVDSLTETVNNLKQNLQQSTETKLYMVKSLLMSVNTSMSEELSAINNKLEEHSSKTASKLAGLDTNQRTLDSKLDSLELKQDTFNGTVMTATSELEHNVLTNVTKELKETAILILGHPYTTQIPNTTPSTTISFTCGGTEGWRRVAYLNMTDPNTNCPSGWHLLTSHSKRTCGKVNTSGLSCDSVIFPVSGGDYTSVCGSIRAYQVGGTDGFEAYHNGHVTTIEGAYVGGVSLTYGSPRQHIWTFVAGFSEERNNRRDACPCDSTILIRIPPFVHEDYFCESGVNSGHYGGFHANDPLWDGRGCRSSSRCCSFNNPPYFNKQLPSPTSDTIEARLCRSSGSVYVDSPVEFMELYVK